MSALDAARDLIALGKPGPATANALVAIAEALHGNTEPDVSPASDGDGTVTETVDGEEITAHYDDGMLWIGEAVFDDPEQLRGLAEFILAAAAALDLEAQA